MRIFLLCFLMSVVGCVFAQDSTTCVVTRYFDARDTSKHEPDRKITFDNRGRIICEQSFSTAVEMDESFYKTGDITRYVFSDSLLTEKVETPYQKNPVKTVYTYNEKGKCIRESKFVWEANYTAAPVKPGMGQGAAVVSGKWNQVSEATITYDEKGRKIAWDASRLHNSSTNMYKWTYDDQNRVTSYQSFKRGGRLLEKIDYQYFDWGYRYWTINYSDDGTPRHELEKGQGYKSMLIHAVTVDKIGHVAEDKVTDETGKAHHSTKYFYDKKGRMEKEIEYNADGEQNDVWLYRYSN